MIESRYQTDLCNQEKETEFQLPSQPSFMRIFADNPAWFGESKNSALARCLNSPAVFVDILTR